MEKLLTEIIQKIQLQKLEDKKIPEYAFENEIRSELLQRMVIELELMHEDGKLEKRDSINYMMFKIKN